MNIRIWESKPLVAIALFLLGGVLGFTIAIASIPTNSSSKNNGDFIIADGVVQMTIGMGNGDTSVHLYIQLTDKAYMLVDYGGKVPMNKTVKPLYCMDNEMDCYINKRVKVYGIIKDLQNNVLLHPEDGNSVYALKLTVLGFEVLE